MNALRQLGRRGLAAVTVMASIGFIATLAISFSAWMAGKAGCYLMPAPHFQFIARGTGLWLFSDQWPDSEQHPAPETMKGNPGIPVAHKFDRELLGFEFHYCELPSASRTVWSVCFPVQAALICLAISAWGANTMRNRMNKASVDPPAPNPDAPP